MEHGDEQDRHQPFTVQQRAQHDGVGIRAGRDPGGDLVVDAEGPGAGGLDEVLVPDELGEGTAGQRQSHAGGEAGRHVVQHVDFLAAERGERPARDFDEQDDRGPFRRGPEALPGDQVQIDRARDHEQPQKDDPDDRLYIEPLLVDPGMVGKGGG